MWFKTVPAWIAAFLLVACAPPPLRPDLPELYRACEEPACVTPVILVHGAFGSRLADARGRERWPGNWLRLLFDRYESLALPLDPVRLQPRDDGLRATDIFAGAGGTDFYGRILNTLEGAGRYRRGRPGEPHRLGERVYYIFAHDWRQDVVTNARRLAALIETIRRDFGRPALRVNVVAHSAGAMVVRYYLRYGGEEVTSLAEPRPSLAGAGALRWVVLVGAPNRGSLFALETVVRGYRVGLGTIPPEVLATFPAAYQYLPDPQRAWLVDPEAGVMNEDLYDVETWRRHRWSAFDPAVAARLAERLGPRRARDYLDTLRRYQAAQLRRARALWRALAVPIRPRGVRVVIMGSDCELTADHLLRGEDGRVRFDAAVHGDPVLFRRLYEPGDGRVTKLSALGLLAPRPDGRSPFPVDYAFFLCERHAQLTGNLHFQTNLLNILLHQEPFRGPPPGGNS